MPLEYASSPTGKRSCTVTADVGRNADYLIVVSVSAVYCASVAECPGKTRLRDQGVGLVF